ncbi:MAG: hypothetical protein COV70_00310 [Parcubacteria group bacterium CG11_big_fil_rev_8_21_14_0_20_39_22]|nr:MAG: hypothetical protein COV70_00310 [Parcubacteria group bacterium CG11_big_fil_rev_8_21_14_0_20_39_22]
MKTKKIFKYLSYLFILPVILAPKSANGACKEGYDDIECLIDGINDLLNILFPFLVGLAVFIIIFNIFVYIAQAANEEKRTEARKYVTWSVIAVFIMISIWGILAILVNTFTFSGADIKSGDIPKVQTPVSGT